MRELRIQRYSKVRAALILIVAIAALLLAMRSLSEKLEFWSLTTFLISLAVLMTFAVRPMFRSRVGRRRGLPSRYERVDDPWRALDRGVDPTHPTE